ncbi:type II secretion system minor pseudopilin GspJ [Mangrovitalea sediminis]|uniref:type II secretion system minor pseudopilin GspJ n=1 Tax=Mangrovitalea sediminis TaxID=1982043 RepID=UPI000BE4C079|nr:type II secretion system minor pseudopilin GspJ [Mangrovitalea sediminis]
MARPVVSRQAGFTLLEVLIAIGITALIGIGIWQVMSGVINSRNGVDRVSTQFEQLQKTVLLIERDIFQVVNRPIRDAYGDAQFAITTRADPYALELTRQGWRNPLNDPRSELQRVAYSLDGTTLHRWQWQVLDRAQDSQPLDQVLLKDVDQLQVRFLDSHNQWVDSWPEQQVIDQQNVDPSIVPMPRAIEIAFDQKQFGHISRIFVLPNFDLVKARQAASRASGSDTTSSGQGASTQTENAQ